MGLYATKSRWQYALQPLVRVCEQRRLHPDWFTYGGVLLAGVAGFALSQAYTDPAWLWLVPVCLVLRLLFNLLDGLLARALAVADPWGEVKNEFGDRLADVAIFLGLGMSGYTDPLLVALALALILCGSYLGILSKAIGGRRLYEGLFGKAERMVSLAVFSLYPLYSGRLASFNLYLIVAAFAAAVTILQRLEKIYAAQQSAR